MGKQAENVGREKHHHPRKQEPGSAAIGRYLLGPICAFRGFALFVDLRKGYSSTIKMGEAGSTRVSFLQNILIGRRNLTERVCARLETGINLPGYFGLPALRREQLHELPIRYQELLESVPDEQLLAQFRYHRVIDYLRHHPKIEHQSQERHLGFILGIPGGSTLFGITHRGNRVTEETVAVLEALPGYEGWFDPLRINAWVIPE